MNVKEQKTIMDFISNNNAACVLESCPKYNECLHGLAFRKVSERTPVLPMVNPKYVHYGEGECPSFLSAAPQRMAKGFLGMLAAVSAGNQKEFMHTLQQYFGRKYYYQMRKGERLITEEEQTLILDLARQCGIPEEKCRFDDYCVV